MFGRRLHDGNGRLTAGPASFEVLARGRATSVVPHALFYPASEVLAAGKAQLLFLRRSQSSIYRNKDRLHALAVGLGVSFRGSRPKFIATKAAQQEVMSASAQEESKHGQQSPGSGLANDQESSN
jgi:hypothetical protein